MNTKRCLGGCTIASIIIAVVGLVVGICSDSIYNMIIRNYVLLAPNSISKDVWMNTPKMQTSVYIFGVENANQLETGGKIKLVEHGPYVYDEYHHKKDVKWNNNGTVTYKTLREYHFNQELSKGKLDDTITIANPISATISYLAKYQQEPLGSFSDLSWLPVLGEKNFIAKK